MSSNNSLRNNAAEFPELKAKEVHLWHGELDLDPRALFEIKKSLPNYEVVKSKRFQFERDRNRFLATRAILRNLLANYLKEDPTDFEFDQGSHGKPKLIHPKGMNQLLFNLSHSENRAIFAFSWSCELGVDIECHREITDLATIAKTNFNRNEWSSLLRLPKEDHLAAFFRCWTRKEAFIKAIGEGLSYPLDQFEVSFLNDEPTQVVWAQREQPSHWWIWNLPVGHRASAALAANDADLQLNTMDFSSLDGTGTRKPLQDSRKTQSAQES